MTANPAERLDLEVIQDLDFDFDPPCESPGHERRPDLHGGPAYALVHVENSCGHHLDTYYCKPFVDGHWSGARYYCRVCMEIVTASFRIIALVRP